MKRRILSMLLVLMMLLTIMPTAALADKSSTDVAYKVECGNIYFDKSTGTITDCDETVTEAIIPSTINGVEVKKIGWAFKDCTKLKSVTIPSSVTAINRPAFEGCTSLKEIVVDPNNASYCSEDGVLFKNDKTEIVRYPIGKTGTEYVIPNSVTKIGHGAFGDCSKLTSITIPSSVTIIDVAAFLGCTGLTSMVIPNSVTGIDNFAFYGCTNLESITIPGSVTIMGEQEFAGCNSLKSINVDVNNSAYSSVDGVLFNKEKTVLLYYPHGRPYTQYAVPNGVATIFEFAFADCTRLTSIEIPSSVTYIIDMAFDGCRSLKDVYYFGSKAQWKQISIGSYNEPLLNAKIHYNSTSSDIGKINGEFQYGSQLSDRFASYSFSYDESWFNKASTVYNHELAKMSMRMTMAGCGTKNGRDKALFIKKLLKDLNFNEDSITAEYPTPTRDSIGYTLAYKSLQDGSTLVSVVIRSGGYGAEWASNFTIGLTNEHQGFSEAASQVIEGIEAYLKKYEAEMTGDIKFWVTGYSRGAATANLVAQRLDVKAEKSDSDNIKKSNIFAYCFECPRNMQKIWDDSYYSKYNNIFNIVNYADIVTKVAMPYWGYTRYGIDVILPSPENTSNYSAAYEGMLKEYDNIAAGVTDAKMSAKKAASLVQNQGSLTNEVARLLSTIFVSQDIYCVGYEDDMRTVMAATQNEDVDINEVLLLVIKYFPYLPGMLSLYPIIHEIGKEIAHAHYPELCLAWMDSLSGKIVNGDKIEWKSLLQGRTLVVDEMIREFRINCPVDVSVYDSSNNLVAQITNDEPIEIEGSFISAYVDENGQKVIVLPTDETYRIEMKATDDGTVSYQVVEVDTSTYDVERLINYYDVAIKTGDLLTGTVEKTVDGTKASYSLQRSGDEDQPIEPTSSEEGNVAQVKLTVSVETGGTASGGGIFNKGEFAKVVATADENSVFEGWYSGDTKVSDEAEYRFRIESDTELTAKFHTHDYKDGKCDCGAEDPDYTPHTHHYRSTVVAPTCTSRGYTVYRCACGAVFTANSTAALGHDTVIKNDKAATCLENGFSGDTVCKVCGETVEKGKTIPALGHTPEEVAAVAATCTETGLTAGSKCSVCGEVLTAQEVVPALGHKFENGVCTVCGAADPDYVAPVVNPFKDVKEGDAFYDEILWAADKGIINGDGTGNYNPNDGITRAQIVMILWNAAGNKEASKPSGFADVKEDAWYAKAVAWAVENGITNGTDLGFEPDRVCTRAEIVTFLHRANNKPAPAAAASFTDLTQDWYKDAVAWAVENGITKGVGDNRFAPNDTCTRGQAAAFMYRLAQLAK